MLGMLDGLLRGGIDLDDADLIVGTSAGAMAGEALAGRGLERTVSLYREASLPVLDVPASTGELMAAMMLAASEARDANEAARRMANLPPVGRALAREADVRRFFAAHLSAPPWPSKRLLVTAVDAESGERAVFDAPSGVPLLEAVMASCAVPGVLPLVTINGRRYADGGLLSPYNVDLASGSSIVVVMSPLPVELRRPEALGAELASLRGAPVHTIYADEASLASIGPNLMAVEMVTTAIDAGAAQARREFEALSSFWTSGA